MVCQVRNPDCVIELAEVDSSGDYEPEVMPPPVVPGWDTNSMLNPNIIVPCVDTVVPDGPTRSYPLDTRIVLESVPPSPPLLRTQFAPPSDEPYPSFDQGT